MKSGAPTLTSLIPIPKSSRGIRGTRVLFTLKMLAISPRVGETPQGSSSLRQFVGHRERVRKCCFSHLLPGFLREINSASQIRPAFASARNSRHASDVPVVPRITSFSRRDDHSLHSAVPVYHERKYQCQSRARVSRISLGSAARNASRPA